MLQQAEIYKDVTPGTSSAWETPPAAHLPCRLTIKGGFSVDDDRRHDLHQQASRLGFADLRSCLRALLGDGWSVPQLATHLATTQAAIRRAIADYRIRQPSHREQLARQRQRAAQQRAAARVAELGFHGLRAYLVDRLVIQAWTLEKVMGELGAAPATLRRLLEEQQVRRVAPTRWQRAAAAAASGPTTQAWAVQQRCQARLAKLGSAGLEAYLQDRYVSKAGRYGACAPNSASARLAAPTANPARPANLITRSDGGLRRR